MNVKGKSQSLLERARGYRSIWKRFVEAVKADGFPSVCFPEHIFHSAYLDARREADGVINIPFKLGNLNFFVSIVAPYIVQRPRRVRRRVEREVVDGEENW